MASVYRRRDRGRWRIEWLDAAGRRRTRTLAAGVSKQLAAALAVKMEREAVEERAGIRNVYAERAYDPLLPAIRDYAGHLEAAGCSPRHVREVRQRLERITRELEWTRLGHIGPAAVTRLLAQQRAADLGARARNETRSVLHSLCAWLVELGRLQTNPISRVPKASVAAERKRERRALRREEADRLLAVTEQRDADRCVVYALALGAGMRRGEIAAAVWADLELEGERPEIVFRARRVKARVEQSVPLPRVLVARLQRWREELARAGRPVDDRAPVVRVVTTINRRLAEDLAAAKIAKKDASGRVVDLHALRHTYITRLAEAGVHPRVAQRLARHSSITLTMAVYTDVTIMDDAAAAERAVGGPWVGEGGGEVRPGSRRSRKQGDGDESRRVG